MLRATLRECTYLPDPVARTYMREYVLRRYRRKAQSYGSTEKANTQLAKDARNWLSFLRRANEGYQKPLEKVLLRAYGRTGAQRRQYLAQMFCDASTTLEVPADSNALKELVNQRRDFGDDWKPPHIVSSLAKSQMSNGIIQSSRVRPPLKSAQPIIPETNSWGKPVCEVRRKNIRQRWYHNTLYSLLPPLPKNELAILDGLISRKLPWVAVQRRKTKPIQIENTEILQVLTDGPQKGHTFRGYTDGRPHEITIRFMRRLWRRISSLVPRMRWNATSSNWDITWDSPKPLPQYAFRASAGLDIGDLSLVDRREIEHPGKESIRTENPGSQSIV